MMRLVRQTIDALVDRLGRHRCFIVTLPHKDANECIQQNISADEMMRCFQQGKTCDPEEIKCTSGYDPDVTSVFENNKNNIVTGYLPPWQIVRDRVQFRPRELSVYTGINGHGKSQFLNYLLLHFMQQGARACIASFELRPVETLVRLIKQVTACGSPEAELRKAAQEWFPGKLWIYDFVGTVSTDRLLAVLEYAHLRFGIDVFVIDSLVKCGIPEDDFNGQQKFIDKLCALKNKYPIHIHLVAHPRKGSDESRIPGNTISAVVHFRHGGQLLHDLSHQRR